MENDSVMTLVAFGGWVSLLCLGLVVAGWIGDKARDRYNKQRGAYDNDLAAVVQADRRATKMRVGKPLGPGRRQGNSGRRCPPSGEFVASFVMTTQETQASPRGPE
jgi:hypothetical protein